MIVSPRNETIKTIRRLRRSKGSHALLEGPNLVGEALTLGLPLDRVLVTPDFLARAPGQALAERLERPPLLVAAEVLEGLSEADSPRGILAIADLPRSGVEALAGAAPGVWLYLDTVQDPGNVGALARVAEGLGATGLLLSPGCADVNHPRALRASAGSLLRLPVAVSARPEEVDRALGRPCSLCWVGLEAHGASSTLESLVAAPPLVVALGSEGGGLAPQTRARLDLAVTIPLAGRLESLNVAVAAALVLYEIQRRGPAPVSSRAAP